MIDKKTRISGLNTVIYARIIKISKKICAKQLINNVFNYLEFIVNKT
jgi:hypothetical protein